MTLYDHPRLRELLAGILADPACDAVRLAWADALAELGDGDRAAQERAEFIRVQVELAGYGPRAAARLYHEQQERAGRPCETPGCRWCALHRREAELLGADVEPVTDSNLWRWLSPSPLPGPPYRDSGEDYGWVTTGGPVYPGQTCRVTFRRGFVESVTLPAAALTHLDAVRACQPVVKVTLTTWPSWMGQRAPDGRLWEVWCEELPGRKAATGKPPPAHLVPAWMLGEMFPGVTFELPAPGTPEPFILSSYR